jgi:antitoxin YefM
VDLFLKQEEDVFVKRKGSPVAAPVIVDENERLKETLDVLSDPDMMRQIRASERYLAKGGKGLSFEQVFGVPLRRLGKRRR